MKPKPMDDLELMSLLRSKEDAAAGYIHGQLGQDREQAMRDFYRMPYGNESEGLSQIVSSDVADTVEWILPALLKIFTSTDKAVSFEPTRASEVEGAEQATDACNYVFYKQNNGFLVLYTAIKDMLTVRNCAVMWRKETSDVISSQPFKGATEEMLAMLLQEKDAEIEAVTPAPMMDPQGQPVIDPFTGQPVMVYNGRLKRSEKRTICKVEAFSPEDLLVDRDWTSPLLQDCPYVCRLMRVTVSDLRQMGFEVEEGDLQASDTAMGSDTDSSTRLNNVNREGEAEYADLSRDPAMGEGWLRIEYLLADCDGDGIAERIVVYRLDNKILSKEVCSQVPIATSSPVLNTHRWDGQGMWDLVRDLQLLHSEILRQSIDNLKLTNNPRTKVLTDANWSPLVNIDDLLDSRVGGIIRQRDVNAVTEQVIPFAGAASLPMLEYVQGMREGRTGVSRTSMGLNPDSLNNTATGRVIDQSSSMQRIELIARIIAETLIKPIFTGILKVLTEGDMEKLSFKLRDKFVELDPNGWRDQYDMSINVGLGTGDVMSQGQKLTNILTLQQAGMQLGITNAQHLYHTATKIIENAGFKDVQNFLQDPSKQPPPQGPPPPPLEIQLEQMRQQAAAQKFQAETQTDVQRFQAEAQQTMQLEEMKAQAKIQEIQANLELQASNDQRDGEREMMKAQFDAQLAEVKTQLERYKIDQDNQTKILIAQIGAQQRVQVPEADGQAESALSATLEAMQAMIQAINAPKQVIRDNTGRAIGIAPVTQEVI